VKSLMLKSGETCRGTSDREVQTEQAEEKHAIRHNIVLLERSVRVMTS